MHFSLHGEFGLGRNRGGIQVLEATLAMPVVLIVTLGLFVLAPAAVVNQAVRVAAQEAAREAAKLNDDQDIAAVVNQTVNEVLSVHGLTLNNKNGVMAVVERQALPVICLGDSDIHGITCPAVSSVTTAGQVKVTVLIESDVAPVPNLLAYWGFDFSNRVLSASSVASADI